MPLPIEPFKVFLSHSEADETLTRLICETLDRLHIRTFVYEYYPKGGINRFERIKKVIKDTEYFLVLLTANGLQSQWVNQEIGYAVGVDKMLIPIVEVDPATGKRLESRGFVELHDPIPLTLHEPGAMIHYLVYTFYNWLSETGSWSDSIFLTCKCGNEFDGTLDYSNMDPKRTQLDWDCPKCHNILSVGLPGFELRCLE